jgi:hypothetical protein
VSGGTAPITSATITLTAKFAKGQNCGSLPSGLALDGKLVVVMKLTNTTGGKTTTVATVKPTNISLVMLNVPGIGFHFHGTVPQNKAHTKPFGGEQLDANVYVANVADVTSCANAPGTTALDHIDFSGGSSIFSLHP